MTKENIKLLAVISVIAVAGGFGIWYFEEGQYEYKDITPTDHPWIETPYGTYNADTNTTTSPVLSFTRENIYTWYSDIESKRIYLDPFKTIYYPASTFSKVKIEASKVTLHNDTDFKIIAKYRGDAIVHVDIYLPVDQLYTTYMKLPKNVR